MDSVHTSLGDLKQFRSLLANGGATVQEIHLSLRVYLSRLSDEWKDAEYYSFVDAFSSTESALSVFIESADTYSRYLQRLLQNLEEYLSTTLRSESATSGAAFRTSDDWHRDLVRRDVQHVVEILGPIVPALYAQWSSLTPTERLNRLRDIQSMIAVGQSREKTPVIGSRMAFNTFGAYDGKRIHLNEYHLANPERFWQLLDTVVHEDRHAYQHWAIKTPGFHSDPAQVRAWAENWVKYRDPKEATFRQYRSQPVENDAFWFAESVILGVIGRKHVG